MCQLETYNLQHGFATLLFALGSTGKVCRVWRSLALSALSSYFAFAVASDASTDTAFSRTVASSLRMLNAAEPTRVTSVSANELSIFGTCMPSGVLHFGDAAVDCAAPGLLHDGLRLRFAESLSELELVPAAEAGVWKLRLLVAGKKAAEEGTITCQLDVRAAPPPPHRRRACPPPAPACLRAAGFDR